MARLKLSTFSFDAGALELDPDEDYLARIPAGITNHHVLARKICQELQCPDLPGRHWWCLDEYLSELSWLDEHRIIIWHNDLPALGPRRLSTYLHMLSTAVVEWREDSAHELIVYFPPEAFHIIPTLCRVQWPI